MAEKGVGKTKKIDKRVVFTKTSIKDTFIKQIKEKSYEEIDIVKLCDEAMISRSAFYLHYSGLNDVLSEVVDEAIDEYPQIVAMILGRYYGEKSGSRQITGNKYTGIFSDRTAASVLISKLTERYKEKFIQNVIDDRNINAAEAEMIFYIQTVGIVGAAARMRSYTPSRWSRLRKVVDALFDGGLKLLEGEREGK